MEIGHVPHYWVKNISNSPLVSQDIMDMALSRSGLTREMLTPTQGTVPYDSEVLLIENLALLTKDAFIGVELGLDQCPRHGSILVYMLFSSSTLGQALENLRKFVSIGRPHALLEITKREDTAHLTINANGPRFHTASH